MRCVLARGHSVLVAGLPTIDIVSCLDHEGLAGYLVVCSVATIVYMRFDSQVKPEGDGCLEVGQ